MGRFLAIFFVIILIVLMIVAIFMIGNNTGTTVIK